MSLENFWIQKLSPLIERSQYIEDALRSHGILQDEYWPELEKVYRENGQKLQELISQNGFPTLSSAGEKGVQLSWHIIYQATPLPDFFKESLTQIRLAASTQDYPADLLARLEDEFCFLEGRPQLYGTYHVWKEGEFVPYEILDPKFVDARRKSIGLPKLTDSRIQHTLDRPPKDIQKKEHDFVLWAKRVGWRI